MRARSGRYGRVFFAWLARSLVQAWHESPPLPRPSRAGLDIPLRPSPLLRHLARGFGVAQLLFAIELGVLRHEEAAVMVLGLVLLPRMAMRWRGDVSVATPRRLLLAADGRIHLLTARGQIQEVQLAGSSLRLGAWLLLGLRGSAGMHRLLLGPDNVAPADLAALRRRLLRVDQAAQAVAPGLAEQLSRRMRQPEPEQGAATPHRSGQSVPQVR